jgi:cytochrome c553
MKLFKNAFSLFVVLVLLLSVGCNYDNEEDLFGESNCGDLSNMSLSSDIAPILGNSCYSCHGNGNESGGINLENYDRLFEVAENGQLLGAIKHLSGYAMMPPSGEALPDCDIQRIEAWIEQGAPNN